MSNKPHLRPKRGKGPGHVRRTWDRYDMLRSRAAEAGNTTPPPRSIKWNLPLRNSGKS